MWQCAACLDDRCTACCFCFTESKQLPVIPAYTGRCFSWIHTICAHATEDTPLIEVSEIREEVHRRVGRKLMEKERKIEERGYSDSEGTLDSDDPDSGEVEEDDEQDEVMKCICCGDFGLKRVSILSYLMDIFKFISKERQ